MAQASNTRSNNVITLQASPAQSGDCISDKMMRELLRRLTASVTETSTPGDAIISVSPPDDKTKIWYPAGPDGYPIGSAYRFNTLTGQWENTAVVPQAPPCKSSDADNLIALDSAGCWIVSRASIETIVQNVGLQVSSDSDNALRTGSDGGLYVETVDVSQVGQIEIFESPVSITSASVAVAAVDIDLDGLPGITTPSWATHAIVRAATTLFTNNLGANSTNKAFTKVMLNGNQAAFAGITISGPNNQSDGAGNDTNDVYVQLDGTELNYQFVVNQSPGWGANDVSTFSLTLLGFIRAGIS